MIDVLAGYICSPVGIALDARFVLFVRRLYDETGFRNDLSFRNSFVGHGGKDLMHGPDEVEQVKQGQAVDVGRTIGTVVSIRVI